MKPDQRNLFDTIDAVDPVDVLIAEYLDAVDHGETPSRADWLARHAEHAKELARFFDDLERLSPPATETVDATQMLPGAKAPKEPTHRESQTVIWDATAGGARPSKNPVDVPFNGTFGDYELLETIARGGMGVVFKARQRQLNRIVALKMILAGQLADDREIQRFRAEAQAAANLDHPGIVQVHEVGEQHGLHYFTMAFVEGKSLAERLRDGPIVPKEAARLVRELASAIAYAHAHGIVHRDLKPANVLIDADGQPKLTDFGLAKQTQSASEMTGTGQILGTPGYMPPEQAQGDANHVGPAADVYGLGALLFALLTGRPPFQGATPVDTIQHVIAADPPRPRSLNPSVPRDLETICLKCLEKAAEKRYASAAALKEDLDRFLDDQPIVARPISLIERTYRWYRRRPMMGTMTAALALLLFAVPILLGGMLIQAERRAEAEADGRAKEKSAREKIEVAERERTKQLFQAYVNEAAARRTSPRTGRSFAAIDRITLARDLADELKLPGDDYTRLRSEALSAFSLIDLRGTKTGPGWLVSQEPYVFNYLQANDCYLTWDKPDGVLVRRKPDDQIVQRVPVENTSWPTNHVRLSPDNRFVSSQVNGKLTIWRVDGKKAKVIARADSVWWAHFAPDRAEMIVYNRNHDVVIQPLDGEGKVKTVRISNIVKELWPSYWQMQMRPGPRRQLAIAGLKRVHLVDLDSGKLTGEIPVFGSIQDIVWNGAGDTVAVSYDFPEYATNNLAIYNQDTKVCRYVKSSVGGPERLCFDAAGQLLLAYNEWTYYFTLVDVPQASVTLHFHQTEISSTPLDQRAAWWQGTTDNPHRVVAMAANEGSPQHHHSAVHPGGRLLATPTTRGIALTDLGVGKRVGFIPGLALYCCFDAAGNLYAQRNGPDGGLHPYRWAIRVTDQRYQIGEPEQINFARGAGLAVNPDGRWVVGGGFTGAAVLDRKTGERILLEPQQDVRHVAIHPKEPWVATFGFGSEGFQVWDATTGKPLHKAGKGFHTAGRFTPDGKYIVMYASGQPGLALWSMPECKFVRYVGPLGAFAISPDSRHVAIGELNGRVTLTRIADGTRVAQFDAPGEEYIADATFSPDGRYLVGLNIDRNRQHIWDLWKLRHRLAEMKLDWETDPAPRAAAAAPITVNTAPAPKK